MSLEENNTEQAPRTRSIRDIVNSPLKKVMFGIQLLSYVLIVGSPFIGAGVGRFLDLKTNAAEIAKRIEVRDYSKIDSLLQMQ